MIESPVANRSTLHPEQAQKPRHVADPEHKIPSAWGPNTGMSRELVPKAGVVSLDIDCLCILPQTEHKHSGMLIDLCTPFGQGVCCVYTFVG